LDFEAILVIGTLCIILGIILLIPGLWWARYKAKKDPVYRKKVNFTATGWIFIILMILFLFSGLLMPYFSPNSFLGKLTTIQSEQKFVRLLFFMGDRRRAEPLSPRE